MRTRDSESESTSRSRVGDAHISPRSLGHVVRDFRLGAARRDGRVEGMAVRQRSQASLLLIVTNSEDACIRVVSCSIPPRLCISDFFHLLPA